MRYSTRVGPCGEEPRPRRDRGCKPLLNEAVLTLDVQHHLSIIIRFISVVPPTLSL